MAVAKLRRGVVEEELIHTVNPMRFPTFFEHETLSANRTRGSVNTQGKALIKF